MVVDVMVQSDLTAAQVGARVILEQLGRIRRHEAGARAGTDAEELHKMRVATRRLRVACALFGDVLGPAGVTRLPVAEAREIADALGAVRDEDVFIAWLDEQACSAWVSSGDAEALARLRAERLERRAAARERMLCALDGPASSVLDGMREALERVASGPSSGTETRIRRSESARRVGRRLMERTRRRLRRRGRRLFAPTPDELHRVRIAAKRFRYVCEFLLPVFADRAAQVEEAIGRATEIQDALGELRDAELAEAALLDDVVLVARQGAGQDGAAIAMLIRAQRARREAALLRFRAAWELVPRKGWLNARRAGADESASDMNGGDVGED